MKVKIMSLIIVFLLVGSFVFAAGSDLDILMDKLRGTEKEPKDPRTVQQIFEGLGKSDKAEALSRSNKESLDTKLWDEIETDNNRKDLIGAGLSNDKTKELLDLWDKKRDKRDFILKKMDEVSESDVQAKEGFNKFTEEYLKKINPGKTVDFEWKDLMRYMLEYKQKDDKPERAEVQYDDGTTLSVPFGELPQGIKKITVEATKITYDNEMGGKFVVNVSDVMPKTGGDNRKWVVIGFHDLADNEYDVMIFFGERDTGVIETLKGGFIVREGAGVKIDNTYDILYSLDDLDQDKHGFIVVYDRGVYIFRGNIVTVSGNGANKLNFSEVALDPKGVMTDFSGASRSISGFDEKVLEIRDDTSGGKILNGNFDKVIGRKFTINSEDGIDYEFKLMNGNVQSGHLVEYNSFVFQLGFINAQRIFTGASGVLVPFTRIGSTLVDLTNRRGSSNMGRQFLDFFEDAVWVIDRIFNVKPSRKIVDSRGYFG